MSINEKNLGKYVRPGIYIEETDNSGIDTPAVQNVLINLVPGFSKKGPFNTPTYVETTKQFEKIFGSIDYNLERKGSFFHRTCEKMLETGPVWALNLLDTVEGRDKLNYVSFSTSSKYNNSNLSNPYTADYQLFFNRQDFWKKDTESFLDLVSEANDDVTRLIHLTNMGDKTITVFMFKSDATNFDIVAETWYGGATKVPSYIHPKSLISDYLVTVLILEGDWTNYKKLSVNSTWSKYFTESGLTISNINDFVNENNVTVLGNYDASLIPNFKDLNDKDMFIENLINDDTDTTSLYCAYNKELLTDNEYLSDLIDLIGFTVAGYDLTSDTPFYKDKIDFLSYNQSLKETINYSNVSLDSPNNVFSDDVVDRGSYGTSWLNWSTSGIKWGILGADPQLPNSPINYYDGEVLFTLSNAYYIINGVKYSLSGIEARVPLEAVPTGYERTDIIYLDANGFQVEKGIESVAGTTVLREINFDNKTTITLGTIKVYNATGNVLTSYTPVTIDDSGFRNVNVDFIAFTGDTSTADDFIKIEFLDTKGSRIYNNEYNKLRTIKFYNELATNLSTNKGVMVVSNSPENGTCKSPIIDPVCTPNNSLTNAYITFKLVHPNSYITGAIYYVDNEFNCGGNVTTISTKYTSVTGSPATTNVIGRYSKFYQDYLNGYINNGDYVIVDGAKQYLIMYIDSNNNMYARFDNDYMFSAAPLAVISDTGNWRQTLEIENVNELTDITNTVSFKISKSRYPEVHKGSYIEAYVDGDYYTGDGVTMGDITPRCLTRVTDVKNDSVNSTLKIIYTDEPIKIREANGSIELYTTVYPPIYDYATHLQGAALTPFKLSVDSIPNGTEARLNTILNVMGKGTQMYKGLINKNKIAWRYLVDSFGLGLQDGSKQQYVDLCGAKLNGFGFINMPSVKQFKKSSNPSFVDEYGAFSTSYLKTGANLDKNPDFLYSFGEGSGSSTVGYFFPYVKHTGDDGVAAIVPPAAFVATAYMRKQLSTSAGVYPWTIVAGVSQGRVTGIGSTEIDFTEDDLTNLASIGVNPIAYVRNVGYVINDESTAQVFPVSSLSFIHSREVLIDLENDLYDMLLRYQWKFNTATIRSEIKYKADQICKSYADKGALYAYKNVVDATDNTPTIIDNEILVVNSYVEIVKGMKAIVNSISIEKTGSISSTGFSE